jgi:mRNA interferase HicA
LSDARAVTGAEFIRRVRRIGRKRGVPVRFVATRGKGDHGTLYYGERRTIVAGRGELKTGTLHGMLRDLGLTLDDLRR